MPSYSVDHIATAWAAIHVKFPDLQYIIHVALLTLPATSGSYSSTSRLGTFRIVLWLPHSSLPAAPFRHSRTTISKNRLEKMSALIFTGATTSTRGNVVTSAFTGGNFGTRALSQSLAKEFRKKNIHITHVRLYQFMLS